ncbi:hypothetical protein A2154_03465 [Candidatus Gottesmanbacteria bacterium RBG_16_43_7]|uniref:Uncharacterized protein n=1 Tax=Candidatus Gottesmanbacteria bacterium RBG_16_43_7 TaxID=1798373 RepID=A0A1F5ZA96_9BACT|nr:MAG: hypothetical protein A2154_03465 [Candidatus Gottesmanbacteria bacterium RBG_16_43_7]
MDITALDGSQSARWQSYFDNDRRKEPFYDFKWQKLYQETIGKSKIVKIFRHKGVIGAFVQAGFPNANLLSESGRKKISEDSYQSSRYNTDSRISR